MWNIVLGLLGLLLSASYLSLYYRASSLITPYKFTDYEFTKINNFVPSPVTIFDEPSLYLSIIAPAYNEEARVCSMLDETIQYLEERQSKDPSFTFEIIVVNDGSKDKTLEVVKKV
jgi:cellulose synthase/poly-beta-1,6-N-acetylglucosamine synthase-like glycosyltransferase